MNIYLLRSPYEKYILILRKENSFDSLEFEISRHNYNRIYFLAEDFRNMTQDEIVGLGIFLKQILSENEWESVCNMFPHILPLIRKHKINDLEL